MFRPCIDLHEGKVKQIVGGTLEAKGHALQTNFVSDHPAAWFAELYRADQLTGGHLIMLGPGNESEAQAALSAYPGGLQIGGGVNLNNAEKWLEANASHVIVTTWIFPAGELAWDRLKSLVRAIGRERLVLDLSCRKRGPDYFVVTDRFQKFTSVVLTAELFEKLAEWCSEFLVHAVDVEGLCRGIDGALVELLSRWSPIPVTYAGGARALTDLEEVEQRGQGKVDLTIGSALDIFGGHGIRYTDAVAHNQKVRASKSLSG